MCSFECRFFFQAEDGIRDLVRSRGLGDVYKRQIIYYVVIFSISSYFDAGGRSILGIFNGISNQVNPCLLYTSDAADERSSVDLGGRRIIKKKNNE